MRFRESLMKFVERYGVNQAMRKYNVHKSYIYFWRRRWIDGGRSIESLREQSRRPRSNPSQHSDEEEKLIKKLGFSLPFALDLSLQLKSYNIIDEEVYDVDKLVSALWKK